MDLGFRREEGIFFHFAAGFLEKTAASYARADFALFLYRNS